MNSGNFDDEKDLGSKEAAHYLSQAQREVVEAILADKNDNIRELVKIAGLDPKIHFKNADLRNVDFGTDDVSGFDFSGADLSGADFRRACGVNSAVFNNAKLHRTLWPSRDQEIGELKAMMPSDSAKNTSRGYVSLNRASQRQALLNSTLFTAMRPEELDRMLAMASERAVRRGQTIFLKGDPGSSMMAVLKGSVRISTGSPDGKEITLNIIRTGEVFGEIALLDGRPRSADATAIEDCYLLVIERRHFLPFLQANSLMLGMVAVLCQRLRQTSDALGDLVMLDLPGRLARLLMRLADDHGTQTPDGIRIEFKLSQRDIGTRMASSRESVNKQLEIWRDAGLVSLDHGYITLRQPERLQELCETD
jgi:CRP/FNR family transcriptional regulator, cyclic AMP receptor protein